MVTVCTGQNTTKQQFQINLVSCTDAIDVLLVNKDSDADKPSVTPVPPPKTKSLSVSQEAVGKVRQTSCTDNSVTVTTASEASENKDAEIADSQSSCVVQRPDPKPQTSASGESNCIHVHVCFIFCPFLQRVTKLVVQALLRVTASYPSVRHTPVL